VRISIPERWPELLAQFLVGAVLADDHGTACTTATEIGRGRGADLGAAERERNCDGRLGAERALTRPAGRHGFEPHREGATRLGLSHCPFRPLAGRAPEPVCALNPAFVSGMLDGLQTTSVTPTPTPRPGLCCVHLPAAG
jgi:predicted ArsR family transcriptional regulator